MESFKGSRFYVVISPSGAKRQKIIPHLNRAKIKYFDYSNLYDPTDEDYHISGDPHPNPRAYELIASRLAKDIGEDSNTEQF